MPRMTGSNNNCTRRKAVEDIVHVAEQCGGQQYLPRRPDGSTIFGGNSASNEHTHAVSVKNKIGYYYNSHFKTLYLGETTTKRKFNLLDNAKS